MCAHATMIRAKKARMSVNGFQDLQHPKYKTRNYRDPNFELRGVYENHNGKTRLFWHAYMLAPFVCPVLEIHCSADHKLVSADLTDLLRRLTL